uniref:Uncharacterized protein, isoform B n=1 Tax=Drosophila melanogaster TaxID=7227 RepID=Q7KTJ8_DROME|nr:uncharacterized protein Dmel_CG33296, isoform C [Drosophila melanogaster]NP_995644.2 uncharacterized protein Dmel_CG33296, isoform B [Drosophila melanogaster]AAS64652.2 uncharacterized protein Dmel_CG33296, isoform B [Drosophila melanogaster]AHN54226.1 uncharacterized protein Dmel_CG33296, isoform C [Drosophila melanogaster]|eukprot:NP_001285711.1 uncharacterized protein Dmel_CG33296, isoform C [Drosophila melanogaster]
MVYETSYASGTKPFSPDPKRGKWEKPTDYLFACFGLALKLDIFEVSYWFFFNIGFVGMLPYFLYMVIYLVPILVVHSFMGQFSSSGFIAAFRLAPLFKGMGYVSIFLTFTTLIYYSMFVAIPLLFLINSFRPTLPWSCEGLKSWHNRTDEYPTLCHPTIYKQHENYTLGVEAPSRLYFDYIRQDYFNTDKRFDISRPLIGLFTLSWALIAIIFYHFSEPAKFGKCIRYMVITTMVLVVVCFVRFLFLPGSHKLLWMYITPNTKDFSEGIYSTFIMALQAFGAGWGSVIALSSFNGFKTDIMSYSWIISFGQIFIYIMFGLVSFMLEQYYKDISDTIVFHRIMNFWVLFLSSASALNTLGWPNLWTFIYYSMLLLASLTVIATQLFTVLQSLFDEFEKLKERKQEVTFGIICGLAICSFFFCTEHGSFYFAILGIDVILAHSLLHLLLLLVVLWIYGQKRFQRDIEFMLGQPFASWKVFILRYTAPIVFLICMILGIIECIRVHFFFKEVFLVLGIILVVLPFLAIPGYGFYYLRQSPGTFLERLKRSCRPTDWYPVEMKHRQHYGDRVGNIEMTDHLFNGIEEVN